jgi:hypothetical protein
MIFRVGPKRVDQDVDIRKDQGRPSIRSSRSALLSRSTPGQVPPPARLTGNDTGGRSGLLIGRRKASLRPCSIRAVRVIPRAAASRRARSSRAWSRRTVVLICRNIHYDMSVCQSPMSTANGSRGRVATSRPTGAIATVSSRGPNSADPRGTLVCALAPNGCIDVYPGSADEQHAKAGARKPGEKRHGRISTLFTGYADFLQR